MSELFARAVASSFNLSTKSRNLSIIIKGGGGEGEGEGGEGGVPALALLCSYKLH